VAGEGVGSGAGRRATGRRAGVVGAVVGELLVFCARVAVLSDRSSVAAMDNFLNMMIPY
jgi:uncharacterized membrane protein